MISTAKKFVPGILLCVIVAVIALYLAKHVSIGAVTIAIGIGVFIKIPVQYLKWFDGGILFCEKHLLAVAITLLGAGLDFNVLTQLGFRSIAVVVAIILWTILFALLIGPLFKLPRSTSMLLGIGNAICGSAAIAATKDLAKADRQEVGITIAIVNFLGAVGMFFIPILGLKLLELSTTENGLLIGSTLQAVGHVVAAGFSVGPEVGQAAVTVKLLRVLLLPVLTVALILLLRNDSAENETKPKSKILNSVPWFIYGFLVLSLAPLFGLISPETKSTISKISKYALVIAMVGIGIRIELKSLLSAGKPAFFAGLIVFITQLALAAGLVFLLKES